MVTTVERGGQLELLIRTVDVQDGQGTDGTYGVSENMAGGGV